MLCKKLDIIKYTLCSLLLFWWRIEHIEWSYCFMIENMYVAAWDPLWPYYFSIIREKLNFLCCVSVFCVAAIVVTSLIAKRAWYLSIFMLSFSVQHFLWLVARYLTCCKSTTQKSIVLVVIDVYRKRSTAALRAETLIIMFRIRRQPFHYAVAVRRYRSQGNALIWGKLTIIVRNTNNVQHGLPN